MKPRKPKLSKTVVPTQQQPQQPKPISQQSTVELARSLQDQFQGVSNAQQEIMRRQQNIWAVNQELDKRETEGNAKPAEKPKE